MKTYLDNDIQTFLAEAGESGCYAICLVEVASEYLKQKLDIVDALKKGIEKKCIYYNKKDRNDNDNFFVQYPETFLYYLTGKHWKVTKENAGYTTKKNEYKINRWERVKTGVTIGHFEMENFHPIENSLTVIYGKIVSTRICKVIN